MLTNNKPVRSLKTKQVLDCLAGITLKIQKNLDLEEILKAAVAETRQLLQADRVLIHRFDTDGNSTVVVQSADDDCLPLNDRMADSCSLVARRVEYCCINGIEEINDLDGDRLELLANSGIRARVAAPIFCGEHLWGWLIARHFSGTRQWQPLEIELQQQLATLLAIAVRQSELQQQRSAEIVLKTPQQPAEIAANRAFSAGQKTFSIPSFCYGKVCRIANIIEKISDCALVQAELQQAKDQFRATIDALPGFVSWMSADGRYLGVNKSLADSFNLSPEEFVGQQLGFLNNSSQFTEFMREFLASDRQAMSRTIESCINENQKYYLIVGQKYQQGRAAVSIGLDITERKIAEKQIKDSLEEKEVLLKEIHHRVKNNLQIVSSLLDLQSMKIRESQTQQLFRASQSRVKSIALIHEKLYKSEDPDRVNCYEYLYSLINYLFQTYSINPRKIALQLDIDPIYLNLDTAIPCGLIINELVSNAFKHAFPGRLKGVVKIRLKASGKIFVLEVSNNGVICPKSIDITDKSTLGIQLINALVQQLSGELEIDRSKGMSFRIKFREISTV